jgi:tRNA-Thr(GGU) m(6)t(6)A37 methyltransferase TsaA
VKDCYEIVPVGYFRKDEKNTWIEILDEYKSGMLLMEEFSHLITLWWITGRDNKDDRSILQVNPKVLDGNQETPLSGVFVTRSPVRPNPVGLTIVKIIKIKDNRIFIDRTDAFDKTPIIDIKPYIPRSDCILNVKLPDHFKSLLEKRDE